MQINCVHRCCGDRIDISIAEQELEITQSAMASMSGSHGVGAVVVGQVPQRHRGVQSAMEPVELLCR